ncbi:MAG: alkylhydroperoxidase like protein AhpD family [Verrucomicrobiaceae bacterium]|nr:alkylhydroperoxidase like protein AhpD family [Verrucomicrobiaceae bacterium]
MSEDAKTPDQACCATASEAPAQSCYYQSADLGRFGEIGRSNPAMANGFFDYYGKVMETNRLTKREKSLIGLAVAHALKCPYCIDSLSNSCLDQGLSEGEMMEAVHVAAALAAGVTLVHSTQMLGHVDARPAKA